MARKTEIIELDKDFPFTIFHGKGFASDKEAYSHNHFCLEINYVDADGGTYYIGAEKYPIKKGDVFIINNYEYHYAINESGRMELFVIVFNPDFVWNSEQIDYQYIKFFYEWKDGFKHRLDAESFDTKGIAKILSEMNTEWTEKRTGYKLVIKSLLLKLLAILYRQFEETESDGGKIQAMQNNYNRILSAIEFIDKNFRDDISLEEISEKANMSANYFSEFFHKTMNCAVFEYILKRRIEHACMKLLTSNDSVANIASDSGFQNISYFNRTFKKLIGVTPQKYRGGSAENQNKKRNLIPLRESHASSTKSMRGDARSKLESPSM